MNVDARTAPGSVEVRFWAVVPAAGVGARMGAGLPKQYLPIQGRTLLEHSLRHLLVEPRIETVVVAVAAADVHWQASGLSRLPRVQSVTGGEARCHSVLNALRHLRMQADAQDWVLVHDAARPCLPAEVLARLLDGLASDPVGGLLALPVADTVKRADATGSVLETVPRERLWYAQTPQMFRLQPLFEALVAAEEAGLEVTDECAAMERMGYRPRLIEGSVANLKVTRPEDLALAEFHLAHRCATQPQRPGQHAG